MASGFRAHLGWLLCAGVVLFQSAAAEAGEPARILGVESRFDSGTPAGSLNRMGGAHLPKFLDEPSPVVREVYKVRWKAPPGGLPTGVALLFEYRQERSSQIRALNIQYPFPVQGERNGTFELAGEALRAAGPVSAWRVRVVYRGRRLAEERSPGWR